VVQAVYELSGAAKGTREARFPHTRRKKGGAAKGTCGKV